jgi:subtilisin family serine protease
LSVLFSLANSAPLLSVGNSVPGEYIVVFKTGLTEAQRNEHYGKLTSDGFQPSRQYSIMDSFHGYSARAVSNATLEFILADENVAYVEENGRVKATDCIVQKDATWGLVRTNNVDLKVKGDYSYQDVTKDVFAYIIDTGIYLAHNEFGGRTQWGTNTADKDDSDGNGHGTHVTGTILGASYGLAKSATGIAVKVLDKSGSGTYEGVVAGVQWTADYNTNRHGGKTSVANLSLGGSKSQALNDAIVAAAKSNVLFVVAAGNSNADACNFSPASAPGVLSVAASDTTDTRASFSNYGKCTNVFGPGVGVTSSWIGNPTATNTISGTSMASPHVAGIAAKLIAENPTLDQAAIKDLVIATASKDKIKNPGTATPNALAFHGCSN